MREGTGSTADQAGDWVRLARRRADMSQRELARAASTSLRTVQRIESGELSPREATLRRLLGVAHLRLAVDPDGAGDDERAGARDRAGRRFPAHLDVRVVDEFGSWWGTGRC